MAVLVAVCSNSQSSTALLSRLFTDSHHGQIMKVSKCINHERCEDLPSGLEIHGNSPSRCGYPRGYPSGCILYISCSVSMEFHGIPWCTKITKLPKKEESVIFCMHPLRPTGQRTLGAPGGTGDVGGLAAPWHDGEIEGLVSVNRGDPAIF